MNVDSFSRSCGTTLATIPYSYHWIAFISLLLVAYAPQCSYASEVTLTLTEQLSPNQDYQVFKAKEVGAATETLEVHFPIREGFSVFKKNFERLQTVSAKTKDFPDQKYLALPAPAYPGSMHKFMDSDEFLRRVFPLLRNNCTFAGSYPSIVYPLFQEGDLGSFLNSLQKSQSLVEKATILSISRSILKGLKLLHEKAHVIHGSLHTRNIWLRRINDNYSASIANMAIYLPIGVPTQRQNVDPGYITIKHTTLVPAASIDVFSFGSVLYQLTLGELVDGESLEEAQAELRSYPVTEFQESSWQFIISKCWSEDKDDRPTIDTILEWLDEFELLSPAAPTAFKITRKLSGINGKVRLYQAEEMSEISMTLLVKVANDYNPATLANNRDALEAELQNLHHISSKLITSSELQHFLLYEPAYPNLSQIELPNGELGHYALVLPFPHRPSLRSFLQNNDMWQRKESQILSIARSVLHNLKVLHERVGMVHANLKPEHILLHPDGQTSIMDFGFATLIGQERDRFSESNDYRPPEASPGVSLTMETSFDVFAFGSLLHELMSVLKPSRRSPSDMVEPFSVYADMFLDSIVVSCRKSKAANRPSIDQILEMLHESEDKQRRKYEDQQRRKHEDQHRRKHEDQHRRKYEDQQRRKYEEMYMRNPEYQPSSKYEEMYRSVGEAMRKKFFACFACNTKHTRPRVGENAPTNCRLLRQW